MNKEALFDHLHHQLIVSCQPDSHDREHDPMNHPMIMAALAQAAALGGAAGIRADGPADIAAIRQVVSLPIIGIFKHDIPGYEVRITPTLEDALLVAAAGADVIALDATHRARPGGLSASELIQLIRQETGLPVFADISTAEEGIAAAEAGADAVLTTLSGYTAHATDTDEPDFELISVLAARLQAPIIAEGRINTPEQAVKAFASGAWAVTVGSAITRPRAITERFVAGIRRWA